MLSARMCTPAQTRPPPAAQVAACCVPAQLPPAPQSPQHPAAPAAVQTGQGTGGGHLRSSSTTAAPQQHHVRSSQTHVLGMSGIGWYCVHAAGRALLNPSRYQGAGCTTSEATLEGTRPGQTAARVIKQPGWPAADARPYAHCTNGCRHWRLATTQSSASCSAGPLSHLGLLLPPFPAGACWVLGPA
jgi:hypothetical protein